MKRYAIFTGVSGFISVGLGAFGAHGLRARLSEQMLDTWQTGVTYQMFHTLALLAIVIFTAVHTSNRWLSASAGCFSVGILIFSGSLYTLVLSDLRWLGAITPIGGLCFLAGWALLAFGLGKAIND